jgi:hypothetical protein
MLVGMVMGVSMGHTVVGVLVGVGMMMLTGMIVVVMVMIVMVVHTKSPLHFFYIIAVYRLNVKTFIFRKQPP